MAYIYIYKDALKAVASTIQPSAAERLIARYDTKTRTLEATAPHSPPFQETTIHKPGISRGETQPSGGDAAPPAPTNTTVENSWTKPLLSAASKNPHAPHREPDVYRITNFDPEVIQIRRREQRSSGQKPVAGGYQGTTKTMFVRGNEVGTHERPAYATEDTSIISTAITGTARQPVGAGKSRG